MPARAPLLALQIGLFGVWLWILIRPEEVPDPIGLGLPLAWTAVCLLAVAAIWIPELVRGRWPATRLDRVLALYVAIVVVTGITGVDRQRTLVALLALAGNVGAYYVTVVLARKAPRLAEGILVALVASFALVLLMAFVYHAELGLRTRPVVYPVPDGWSGYPELGTLAMIQFGLLVAALQTVNRYSIAIATVCLLVVNLVELAFLYSRQVWPTIGLIALVSIVLMLRGRNLARLAITGAIVAVVGLGLFVANPTLRYLATVTVDPSAVSPKATGYVRDVAPPQMRFDIWQRTLRMIRDHPVAGVGLGNFQAVYESIYNPEVNNDGRRGVHAHDLWLQHVAELGVIGGIVYIVLWAAAVRLCWLAAMCRPTFATIGVLLAVVAVLGANVPTNMFYLTGGASGRIQTLTWMLFGLAAADLTSHRSPQPGD